MAGNGWNSWKWLEIALMPGNCWKDPKLAGNEWKGVEMAGLAGTG